MGDGPIIFICYSHRDEEHKNFIVSHLEVAARQGVFDVWDDRRIKSGGNWQAEIDAALDRADIAVLLISRHFLTSDFIMSYEVIAMRQRHASDNVVLYPILISDCAWASVAWLRPLNLRPIDGVPLNSFSEVRRDQVMADIAEEVVKLLHPAKDRTSTTLAVAFRQRRSSTGRGFFAWWQAAGVTTRATVLSTVFAGLAVVWGIIASFMDGGHSTSVTNGNVVGGDMISSEVKIEK